MVMVPKGDRANVADMEQARRKKKGGRPSGLGYDPVAGEEVATETLERSLADVDPESDVFAQVGKRGYSEHRFYIRSTDANGHGDHLRVRLPQGIEAQVYGIVRDVPEYRTIQYLIRDALVHRLEYLQKRYRLTDDARRLMELERWRADSEKRSAEISALTATVTDVADKLTAAWEAKDYALFAQELNEADEQIDWLREPYKTRLVDIVTDWKRRGRKELDRVRDQMDE